MGTNDFHIQMMKRAIEHSKKAVDNPTIHEPFGAVVVRNSDRKIIGEGCNNMREVMDPSLHGEVVAIKNACKEIGSLELPGCALYTSCEPCSMCASLIWITKIEHVYYGNACHKTWENVFSPDKLRETVAIPTEKRSNYTNILHEEANQVILDWAVEEKKLPADKKYYGVLNK